MRAGAGPPSVRQGRRRAAWSRPPRASARRPPGTPRRGARPIRERRPARRAHSGRRRGRPGTDGATGRGRLSLSLSLRCLRRDARNGRDARDRHDRRGDPDRPARRPARASAPRTSTCRRRRHRTPPPSPCPAGRRRRWRASAPRSSGATRRRAATRRGERRGIAARAHCRGSRGVAPRSIIGHEHPDRRVRARPRARARRRLVRVVSGAPVSPNEEAIERALRPKGLAEYVGQAKAREQLEIFIGAARKRGEAMDHVLLFGPPGLGKTTLVAHHRQRARRQPALDVRAGARKAEGPRRDPHQPREATTSSSSTRSIASRPVVEEILYPALEDYQIDIMIGEGPAARSIKLDLQPFTLIGATTRAGMLTNPLRDRFGIVARLEFYSAEELTRIVRRSAGLLDVPLDGDGALRDRAPLARHAAHRQPAAAARARLRRDEGRRPHHASRSPTRRWRCSMSTCTAST